MKLYGLLVVQNEADVIEDLLQFLKNLGTYEAIFFFDLGSSDNTFEKAQKFKDLLYKPQVLQEPYTEKLRYDLLAQYRPLYKEGDWLAIIDADEFYVDDPITFIQHAEKENAGCVRTYQIEFMFTDLDLAQIEKEDRSLPIYDRRKHYLINWSEPRFLKFLDEDRIFSTSKPASRRFLNRHYPNRTPEQMDLRIKTRLENKKKTRRIRGRQDWLQIYSPRWQDYIASHRNLHLYDGGEFRFGLPEGVRWKDYFSKDPFSTLAPQIATMFLNDTKARISPDQNSGDSGEGKITFQDTYGNHVSDEISADLSTGRWMEAFDGMLVLIRYKLRTLRTSLRPAFNSWTNKWKTLARNVMLSLKRLALAKSIGILTANPNPIDVSDVSDAGVTTFKWKTFFTETIELRIDSPDGPVIHSGKRSGSFTTGNWISNDMAFFLQDASSSTRSATSNTISTVVLKIRTGDKFTL